MSEVILDTHALCELLKSWWHRGKSPQLYYHRDRDGREIDFIMRQDHVFHPSEVEKSASPKRQWIGAFSGLTRLKHRVGEGGGLCLRRQVLPLAGNASAIPIGLI